MNEIRRKLKELKEEGEDGAVLNGSLVARKNNQQIIFQEYVNERFHSVEQELSKFMHSMGDQQRELHDLKVKNQHQNAVETLKIRNT